MFFSSAKERNNLISKGVSTFAIEKSDVNKNFYFLGKKISRNALGFKSKKVQGIFEERLF